MIKRDRASIESVIAMIQTKYSDDTKGMDVALGEHQSVQLCDGRKLHMGANSAHARELLCEGLDKTRFDAELVREFSEFDICLYTRRPLRRHSAALTLHGVWGAWLTARAMPTDRRSRAMGKERIVGIHNVRQLPTMFGCEY